MNRFLDLRLIAVLALFAGCASTGSQRDVRAQILALDADWSRAAAEGRDVDRVVSYWADDAIVLPPGGPALVGKAAIREFVAKSFQTPGFSISWKTTDVVVARSGDLAYSTGINRVTFNGPDGKQVVLDGKAVAVWRMDKDGAWKCVVDIWNESNPP